MVTRNFSRQYTEESTFYRSSLCFSHPEASSMQSTPATPFVRSPPNRAARPFTRVVSPITFRDLSTSSWLLTQRTASFATGSCGTSPFFPLRFSLPLFSVESLISSTPSHKNRFPSRRQAPRVLRVNGPATHSAQIQTIPYLASIHVSEPELKLPYLQPITRHSLEGLNLCRASTRNHLSVWERKVFRRSSDSSRSARLSKSSGEIFRGPSPCWLSACVSANFFSRCVSTPYAFVRGVGVQAVCIHGMCVSTVRVCVCDACVREVCAHVAFGRKAGLHIV